jgi:hypothetical protein
MSSAYAAVYSVALPKATQVVDPFHLISLANRCLDAVRRRVQSEQTGHRGRRDDPLYRARRTLLFGEEKLDEKATQRLWSLLELGDPNAEVAIAYRIKERVRDFYRTLDPGEARAMLNELQGHCVNKAMPPEVQKRGRTIKNWFDKIANFHVARVTNGPTEALNNLIKRIKRIGFGFRNFENYRIRAFALRRHAELACARLDRPVRSQTPPDSGCFGFQRGACLVNQTKAGDDLLFALFDARQALTTTTAPPLAWRGCCVEHHPPDQVGCLKKPYYPTFLWSNPLSSANRVSFPPMSQRADHRAVRRRAELAVLRGSGTPSEITQSGDFEGSVNGHRTDAPTSVTSGVRVSERLPHTGEPRSASGDFYRVRPTRWP